MNVPIAHREGPNPDFIRVMKASFPADAKIVVGCKSGVRSLRAAQALVAEGSRASLDQRAGWDGARDAFGQVVEPGWVRAGLPREDGAPAGPLVGRPAKQGGRLGLARRRPRRRVLSVAAARALS